MRHFITLTLHELKMLCISPASYVAAVLFLLFMTFVFFLGLRDASAGIADHTAIEYFFHSFWIPVLFMVPLLTMRTIAEERRLGTLEALLTTPASALVIVLSKFVGVYVFYMIIWLLTLLFPLIVQFTMPAVAAEGKLLDPVTLFGGFSFIAVSGTFYISVGILASSMTRTQLIAGMLTFCALFITIVGGVLMFILDVPSMDLLTWLREPLDYMNTFKQLEDFCRGVIDSRPFFFYISNTFLLLGVTALIIDVKV